VLRSGLTKCQSVFVSGLALVAPDRLGYPGPMRAALPYLLALLLTTPIAVVLSLQPFPPLQDLPQHLLVARLSVTPAQERPPEVIDQPAGMPLPYRPIYSALSLAGPDSVLLLGRLSVALAVLCAAFCAVYAGSAQENYDPWLLATSGIAAGGFMLWSGFLAFLLAMAPLLLLVGAFARLLGDAPPARPLSIGLAAALLLYLLHPLVALLGAAIALVAIVLSLMPDSKAARPHLLALGLTACVGAALSTAIVLSGSPEQSGPGLLSAALDARDLPKRLWLLLDAQGIHLAEGRRGLARFLSLAMLLGLALPRLGAIRGDHEGPADARPGQTLVRIACAGSALATLVLPFHYGSLHYFGTRFALPAWLLLPAALGAVPVPNKRLRRGSRILAFGSALGLSLLTANGLQLAGDELVPLEEIGAVLKRESKPIRLFPLSMQWRSQVVVRIVDNSLSAHDYALVIAGGVSPHLFTNPLLPIQLESSKRLRSPPLTEPLRYDPRRHGRGASHLLLRLPPFPPGSPPPGLKRFLERIANDYRPLCKSGAWRLYRRRLKSGGRRVPKRSNSRAG